MFRKLGLALLLAAAAGLAPARAHAGPDSYKDSTYKYSATFYNATGKTLYVRRTESTAGNTDWQAVSPKGYRSFYRNAVQKFELRAGSKGSDAPMLTYTQSKQGVRDLDVRLSGSKLVLKSR